jgi:hypothetical protein
MFERYFLLVAQVLFLSGVSAHAQCCAPPPTTPNLAWPIPYLGAMDPSTHLQHSFDSGKQGVGAAPFSEYWYKFDLVALPQGTGLTGFIATGPDFKSTITVLDNNLRPLGPFNGTPPLQNGIYYIHVTAPSHTFFHFGVVAPPPLAQFPNTAGHTEAAALDLGPLRKLISSPTNSFYTFFKRIDPSVDSPTQQSLTPDFSQPNPNPPLQSDFYAFTVPMPGPVKLTNLSDGIGEPKTGSPKYILKLPDGTKASWASNQTLNLAAGKYLVQVVDQRTEVADNVTIRNAQFEDFEHYRFQLLFQP